MVTYRNILMLIDFNSIVLIIVLNLDCLNTEIKIMFIRNFEQDPSLSYSQKCILNLKRNKYWGNKLILDYYPK